VKNVIVITGASSGFGALAARALARAGHTLYASMLDTKSRNASQVNEVEKYATEYSVDLRAIELDVSSQSSCDAAIQEIILQNGHRAAAIRRIAALRARRHRNRRCSADSPCYGPRISACGLKQQSLSYLC
jgi:NAD(P)-dependent dehydrogenase (short-subunit alcohol dehydrogenase family)